MKLWLLLTFLVGIVSTLKTPSQAPLCVGNEAPDFELDSIGGDKVKPVDENLTTVLVFSRAHWCPYCLKQLLDLRRNSETFKAAGARVVVVFREEAKGIDGLKIIKKRSKADFTFALDNGKQLTADYSAGEKEFSTYIIDTFGRIQAIIKGDMKNRAKSQRILDAIDRGVSSLKNSKGIKPVKPSIFRFFGIKTATGSNNPH